MPSYGPLSGLPLSDALLDVSELTGPLVLVAPRRREYLLVVNARDLDTETEQLVCLSGAGYTALGDGAGDDDDIPDWTRFRPAIMFPGNSSLELISQGRWATTARRTLGSVRLANARRELDDLLMLQWKARRARMWFGPLGWAETFADFAKFLEAEVAAEPLGDRDTVTVSLTDQRSDLEQPLSRRLFTGLGNGFRQDSVGGGGASAGPYYGSPSSGGFTARVIVRLHQEPNVDGVTLWSRKVAASVGWTIIYMQSSNAMRFRLTSDTATSHDAVVSEGEVSSYLGSSFEFHDGELHVLELAVDLDAGELFARVDGYEEVQAFTPLVYTSPLTEDLDWLVNANNQTWEVVQSEFWNYCKTIDEHRDELFRIYPGRKPAKLAGLWTFDEGADSTGFNQIDAYRDGMSFDGSSQYIELTGLSAPLYDPANGYSVEIGLRDDGNPGTDRTLWAEGRSSDSNPIARIRAIGTGSRDAQYYIRTDGGSIIAAVTATDFFDGSGPKTLGLSDRNGVVTMYRDGEPIVSGSYTPGTLTLDRFGIGALLRGVAALFWPGAVFFFRGWRRELSAAEFADNAGRLEVTDRSDLAIELHLDETTGTPVETGDEGATVSLVGGPSWINTNAALVGPFSWVGSGEGPPEMAGVRRPWVRGQVRHFPGELVDRQRGVYELASNVVSGDEIDVEGFADGAPLTSNGEVSDVYGSTPGSGEFEWSVHGSRLLVRLGGSAPSEAEVTWHVRVGELTTSALLERIARDSGYDEEQIDLFGLGLIEEARPGTVGFALHRSGDTGAAVFSRLVAGIGGYWYLDLRSGILRVKLRAAPAGSPDLTFGVNEVGARIREVARAAPFKRTICRYRRHYATLSESDIAGSVSGDERTALALPWRSVSSVESKTVVDNHPGAIDLEVETYYDLEADAQDELDRRVALDRRGTRVLEVDVVDALFQNQHGQEVRLVLPWRDLDAGRDFIVGGIVENQEISQTTLTLWEPYP